MGLDDLQVFSDYLEDSTTEVMDQEVEVFNGATNNGMILRSASNRGDETNHLKYQIMDGLIRERDPDDSTTDATVLDLARIMEGSVKFARGVGPVNISPGLWEYINRNPAEAGSATAQQLAPAVLQDKVNTAILSYVAAVQGEAADLVHDYSGTGKCSMEVLLDGAAKFGDRSQSIVVWVMHSKVWFDLVKAGLANATNLWTFGDVKVMKDALGKPFVITDSPNLKDGAKYLTLGLTPGAVVMEDDGVMTVNTETTNGKVNIRRTYQGEYLCNVGVKGFKWNTANGGAHPTNAALGSSANWTRALTSEKDMAGVLVITQ